MLGTLTASALLVLASCSPQAFVISPEMRGPSKSGLYLAGKSIGVVYSTDKDSRDTEFNSYLASGFASRLEEDYFGGNQLVELFQMPYSAGADYASRDSMVNLVMDTGKGVVFFIDNPELGEAKVLGANKVEGTNLPKDSSYVSVATVPFTTRIYVYDSMGKEDKVLAYSGSKEVSAEIYSDGRQDAAKLARKASTLVAPSAIKAGILALARNGIMLIPMILILPRLLQLTGVIWAQPAADALSFIVAIFMLIHEMGVIHKLQLEQESLPVTAEV